MASFKLVWISSLKLSQVFAIAWTIECPYKKSETENS